MTNTREPQAHNPLFKKAKAEPAQPNRYKFLLDLNGNTFNVGGTYNLDPKLKIDPKDTTARKIAPDTLLIKDSELSEPFTSNYSYKNFGGFDDFGDFGDFGEYGNWYGYGLGKPIAATVAAAVATTAAPPVANSAAATTATVAVAVPAPVTIAAPAPAAVTSDTEISNVVSSDDDDDYDPREVSDSSDSFYSSDDEPDAAADFVAGQKPTIEAAMTEAEAVGEFEWTYPDTGSDIVPPLLILPNTEPTPAAAPDAAPAAENEMVELPEVPTHAPKPEKKKGMSALRNLFHKARAFFTDSKPAATTAAAPYVYTPPAYTYNPMSTVTALDYEDWKHVYARILELNNRYRAIKPDDKVPLITLGFLTDSFYSPEKFINKVFKEIYGEEVTNELFPTEKKENFYNSSMQSKAGTYSKGDFMDKSFAEWEKAQPGLTRNHVYLVDDTFMKCESAAKKGFAYVHNHRHEYVAQYTYTGIGKFFNKAAPKRKPIDPFITINQTLDRIENYCRKLEMLANNPEQDQQYVSARRFSI